MGRSPFQRSTTSWGTLGEFRDGLGHTQGVPGHGGGSEDPRGGPERVGGPSGRSDTWLRDHR